MRNRWTIGIVTFTLLFILTAVLFRVFDIDILPSQFFGALIGVVITAIITVFLLQGQASQEVQRDKDVKIFEQKIVVYSQFTEKMWGMLDDGVINPQELKELRDICFRKLVFYLNHKQIINILEQIQIIDDAPMRAAGEITKILQSNLYNKVDMDIERGDLISLFSTFDRQLPEPDDLQNKKQFDTITYWHFNMLSEKEQIGSFKRGNWVLALIEYGEDWRTGAIKQVKPNDVIFLFRRGGNGYIGAFKALSPSSEILNIKDFHNGEDLDKGERIEKYDIYRGLDDGASLCSNILVEPIAYNFKGVGCKSVRRRTIERMNDPESVKFLLNRFNNGKDLEENRKDGIGKLDDATPVIGINNDYFSELIKKNKL